MLKENGRVGGERNKAFNITSHRRLVVAEVVALVARNANASRPLRPIFLSSSSSVNELILE